MPNNFHNKSGQGAASLPAAQAQELARTLLQQALVFHQKGQLALAQNLYESLLKIQPRHFEGLRSLSSLASQTNRHQMAIELLSRAIEVNPKSASLHANIGSSFQALQRFGEALISYDKAIALESNFVEAHNNRGNTLRSLNKHDDALISYDRAIALKSDYAEAYNGRGGALAELGQFDNAVSSYDQAIALKSDYAEAYNNRGVALHALDRLEDGLASYDQAIELKSHYAEAYSNRGDVLNALDRFEDGLASYDRAIALEPYYPEAYYNRGNTLQRLERLDEAVISYDKAIALQPDYPDADNQRKLLQQTLNRASVATNNAPVVCASSSPRATRTKRAYMNPIMPGFERHYANYRYVPSRFADNDIITIDGHDVRVRDRLAEPEIVIFENILSDVECELLIELSRPKLQRSGIYDSVNPSAQAKISNVRTSEGTHFLRGENPLLHAIETRLAKLMNSPYENGEEMHILRYSVGAEYRPHYDFFPPEVASTAANVQASGQRITTLVMYLNDVESGGETIFPEIDFTVVPRKGSGVFFSYLDANGKLDRLTWHGGAPVTRGEKWIATKWVRQHGWRIRK